MNQPQNQQDRLVVTSYQTPAETTDFIGDIQQVTLNGVEITKATAKQNQALVWLFGILSAILAGTALVLGFQIHQFISQLDAPRIMQAVEDIEHMKDEDT